MLFCSFEARYRVISGLFKCLIPRRWRHWLLSSRTLISASTRSPHIFWSKHLLNSSQKQVCFFGFDTFTNNYAVCSSLCKESQFCVCVNCLHILSILSDHACIARSFMCMPLGTSDVLQYNFHPAWTEMIRRKMRVRLVRSKGNVWLSTSSNFASIPPLSGVFNLLCIGEGKEASVKVSD